MQLIKRIRQSARLITSLPPDLQRIARDSYSSSLKSVFFFAACSTMLAYLVRLPVGPFHFLSITRPYFFFWIRTLYSCRVRTFMNHVLLITCRSPTKPSNTVLVRLCETADHRLLNLRHLTTIRNPTTLRVIKARTEDLRLGHDDCLLTKMAMV